ncbi:MAG TPA: anti-sigma factor [Acidimicrobiia bacterium]|nr:anti-sigma factor [Acidimicrobiia bacterium]
MSGSQYTHQDIAELLGAFALDAVDDEERDVIEAHLAGCPRCRAEVEGHRETAALLAHSGARAPEGVWDRIAGAIDESPPALDLARLAPAPGAGAEAPAGPADELAARRAVPRSIPLRVAAATMAVAAALALLLGVALGRHGDDGLGRLDAAARALEKVTVANAAYAALNDVNNERVQLASTDGKATAQVVRLPDGTGYLVPNSLARLPAGRVYQLWAVRSDAKISLGVLGPEPAVSAFRMTGPVAAYAVTEEAAGGVGTTQNQPVIVGFVKA